MATMKHPTQADLPTMLADAGIRQADIAGALGISQAAVSRKIGGKIPWKITELRAVAGLLGVDTAALIEAVGE